MQKQRDEAKTRRSRDGTWTKKGGKSHFGYKLHNIIDRDYELIRRFKTTTASVHDSYVDITTEHTLEQNHNVNEKSGQRTYVGNKGYIKK